MDIPHPDADWNEFIRAINNFMSTQKVIFCPVNEKFKGWIDIKNLKKIYSKKQNKSNVCNIS